MKFKVQRNREQKLWRRQGVGLLCCLLSFVWFGIPSFHSFCHFAELPHQHPSGSALSHDHGHYGHDHDHREQGHHSHDHKHHDHEHHDHRHHDHSHRDRQDLVNRSLAGNETAENGAGEPSSDLPHREPSDSEGPLFSFQLLESESCCSAPCSLFLAPACPALGVVNAHGLEFFSSAELGTIGARGPPISLGSFFLKLV
ncbi:MAG: hypothetical protein ACPHO8_08990 [Mariniblastus sp.]